MKIDFITVNGKPINVRFVGDATYLKGLLRMWAESAAVAAPTAAMVFSPDTVNTILATVPEEYRPTAVALLTLGGAVYARIARNESDKAAEKKAEEPPPPVAPLPPPVKTESSTEVKDA